MKLTLQLKLLPTPEQYTALRETMRLCNAAATYAAATGFAAGVFGQVAIHHLAYYEIRARFGLSSQLAVRAIDAIRRIVDAQEIAQVVTFLASTKAAAVTGVAIDASGGSIPVMFQ